MCDVLAISAGHNYTPKEYLPLFAERGKNNMNGWGIGFYRDHQALVETSSERVFSNDHVHESFERLARVIDSRVILSHISCPLSGITERLQNYPLSLSFLNHVWLFVHVGVVEGIENYQTKGEPLFAEAGYSARILEYLRDRMEAGSIQNRYSSLLVNLRAGIRSLTTEFPGHYTFVLTNESVVFVFSNFRPLMVLKESDRSGDVLLITSVSEGLSSKEWFCLKADQHYHGLLVIAAGPDLLHLENLAGP